VNALISDPHSDTEADSLTNAEEFAAGTNPTDPDSEGNGMSSRTSSRRRTASPTERCG
jgi:hypothetical protein